MVACELRAYDSRRTGLRAIELESSMGFIEHALISGSVPIGGGGGRVFQLVLLATAIEFKKISDSTEKTRRTRLLLFTLRVFDLIF